MSKTRDQGYLARLQFGELASIHHPMFDGTHALFGKFFFHDNNLLLDRPEPLVSRDGFDRLFSFNDNADVQQRWGPMRLQFTYAYDPHEDRVVGGSTYVAMILPAAIAQESGLDVIYMGATLFVDTDQRGRGLALTVVDRREDAVARYAAGITGKPAEQINLLAIHEQNDPRKMTLEEIEADIEATGTHPCVRMIGSRREGWRTLDARFHYREIDSPGDEGIDYMSLCVKGRGINPPPVTLPPSVIAHFLTTYAARRHLGRDPSGDPKLIEQLDSLRRLQVLTPVDDSATLMNLKPLVDAALEREAALRRGFNAQADIAPVPYRGNGAHKPNGHAPVL